MEFRSPRPGRNLEAAGRKRLLEESERYMSSSQYFTAALCLVAAAGCGVGNVEVHEARPAPGTDEALLLEAKESPVLAQHLDVVRGMGWAPAGFDEAKVETGPQGQKAVTVPARLVEGDRTLAVTLMFANGDAG